MDSTADTPMGTVLASNAGDGVAALPSERKGKQRTSEERKAEADRWTHWTDTCRLLPTKAQHRRLERALDVTRELYNAALEERFTKLSRWHQTAKFKTEFQPAVDPATGRKVYPKNPYFPSSFDGHKDLTELRDPKLGMPIADYPATLGRGVINRAASAFQAFYARKSNSQKGGRPRFKPASRWRTLEFSELDGVRAVWNPSAVREAKVAEQALRKAEKLERDRLHRQAKKDAHAAGLPPPPRAPKPAAVEALPTQPATIQAGTHLLVFPPVGALRLRTHRAIPEGSIMTGIRLVQRAGGVWEAHLGFKAPRGNAASKETTVGDGGAPLSLEDLAPTLGIDWNIGSLAVCSDGFKLPNTRLGKKARKARRAQERLVARSKKGSKTRAKKVKRLAVLREREAGAKRTERHTDAKRLVDHALAKGHLSIAVEDIDTAGLLAKKKQKKALDGTSSDALPWETSAGQRALKRELADASIGMLKQYTLAKAASAGLGVVLVPAYGTTQACARCGTTSPTKLTLSDRVFSCACGWKADRDVNAGLVMLRRGRGKADPRPKPDQPWSPPMPHPALAQVGTVGAHLAQAGQKPKTSRKGLGP